MDHPAAISLRGVRKEFPGGVVAVHGLDLDIADGEFVTLLGPSGSGKTTVLRMIAGFERPTAGTVSLRGRDGTWSVRPEKIGLTGPDDDPPPDTTTATGTVSEIVYTGATTRCLVALDAPDVMGPDGRAVRGLRRVGADVVGAAEHVTRASTP